MTGLVDLLMSGGGLAGASPRQISAVLPKLEMLATVVEHRTLPHAIFGVAEGEPFDAYWNTSGAMNTTSLFASEHSSPSRAVPAVGVAIAVSAAVLSTVPHPCASYGTPREQHVRHLLERHYATENGTHSLAEGFH